MKERVYKIEQDDTDIYIATYIAPFDLDKLRIYKFNIINNEILINGGDGQFVNNWGDRSSLIYDDFTVTDTENYNITEILQHLQLYASKNSGNLYDNIVNINSNIDNLNTALTAVTNGSWEYMFTTLDPINIGLDGELDATFDVSMYSILSVCNSSTNCTITLKGFIDNPNNGTYDITQSGYNITNNTMCGSSIPVGIVDWEGINLQLVYLVITPTELPATVSIGYKLRR